MDKPPVRQCPNCGKRGIVAEESSVTKSGWVLHCKRCNYRWEPLKTTRGAYHRWTKR